MEPGPPCTTTTGARPEPRSPVTRYQVLYSPNGTVPLALGAGVMVFAFLHLYGLWSCRRPGPAPLRPPPAAAHRPQTETREQAGQGAGGRTAAAAGTRAPRRATPPRSA